MEPELTVEAEPEHQAVCPICEQVIVDPSDEEDGEEKSRDGDDLAHRFYIRQFATSYLGLRVTISDEYI